MPDPEGSPAGKQLASWGVSPEEQERFLATLGPPPDTGLELLPSCVEALNLWGLVCGQWRMASQPVPAGLGMVTVSRPVALDYPALEATARMSGTEMTPELFDDVREIEQGALGAFASKGG